MANVATRNRGCQDQTGFAEGRSWKLRGLRSRRPPAFIACERADYFVWSMEGAFATVRSAVTATVGITL